MNLVKTLKRGNLLNFYAAVIFTVLISAQMIFTAYLFKSMIDICAGGSVHDLVVLLIICACYIVIYYLFARANRYFKNKYLFKASLQYKEEIFRSLLDKEIGSDAYSMMSDYNSGLTIDIKSIEDNYILSEIEIIQQIFLFVLGLATMLYLSVIITLVLLVTAIFPVLISLYYEKRIAEHEKNASDEHSKFIAIISDLLTGFSVIKIFHIESEAEKLFQKTNESLELVKIKRRNEKISLNLGMFIATFVITVILSGLGVYLTLQGVVTLGTVVAFIQLMDYVVQPAGKLGTLFANRKAAYELVKKMETNLEAYTSDEVKPEQESIQTPSLMETKNICEFKNVSFNFSESDFSLQNISCLFEKGKHYAIIGPSGSGKSTLLKLILGYHMDYMGDILFDGIDLKKWSKRDLYTYVSYVQQSTFIFNDTILNNVTLYREHQIENINYALKVSGLAEIIDSRSKDYICGVGGSLLSGGEKQRIAIARALLVQPKLLILDEATAALNHAANKEIMEAIINQKNLTSISIMHRVDESLLSSFDSVLVMNQGKIQANSSYDELKENAGFLLDVLL